MKNELATNRAMKLVHTLESTIVERSKLIERLGLSYGDDRDLYKALGYRKTPNFSDYYTRYKRQDIARRVVNAPTSESWRMKPIITENQGEKTKFEEAWEALVKDHRIWHYLTRADRISGIGEYGVLLMGFNDVSSAKGLKTPVNTKSDSTELIYLQAYTSNNASIKSFVSDTRDPRFGMPEIYEMKIRSNSGSYSYSDYEVHYSRVIHIADGAEENDVYGTPRLQCVLNRLMDLEKVVGGSAEMFWRGAFPGFALEAEADANIETLDLDDLEEEMQNYLHNLQRYIRLQGIKINQLDPQVADPSKHFDTIIQLISAATDIPKRILLGSERGELASSQDETHWSKFIDSRREDFVEPVILRPFIDKMISVKILPEPTSGNYSVKWPDLTAPTEKTKADIRRINTEALSRYVLSPGADIIVPPEMFLSEILGWNDAQIKQAMTLSKRDLELDDIDQDVQDGGGGGSQSTEVVKGGEE